MYCKVWVIVVVVIEDILMFTLGVDRRLARKFSSLSITLIINDINIVHWNIAFYIKIYVIMWHQAVLHNFQSLILFSMCDRKHR